MFVARLRRKWARERRGTYGNIGGELRPKLVDVGNLLMGGLVLNM